MLPLALGISTSLLCISIRSVIYNGHHSYRREKTVYSHSCVRWQTRWHLSSDLTERLKAPIWCAIQEADLFLLYSVSDKSPVQYCRKLDSSTFITGVYWAAQSRIAHTHSVNQRKWNTTSARIWGGEHVLKTGVDSKTTVNTPVYSCPTC